MNSFLITLASCFAVAACGGGGTAAVSFNAAIDSTDVDMSWRLLDVETGEIVAPDTLMPGEDVVLVAVVLPTEEIWTGNQSFVQRRADLVLTTNP